AQARGLEAPAAWQGVEPDAGARAVAESLASGERVAVWLGNAALQHPQAGALAAAVQWIAQALGARWGAPGEAANTVGGYLAEAMPRDGGLAAGPMLAAPRRAYLLLGCEPDCDFADARLARSAMAAADSVIALSAYRSADLLELADCLLPVAPFTETAGTFVNCEGRVQAFTGVVRPLGESRPAWKVLRVLANLVGATGFDHDSSESVRSELLDGDDVSARLSNRLELEPTAIGAGAAEGAIERVADVPIYFVDPLVRRAESLQQTADARVPRAWMAPALMQRLGIAAGDRVRLRQEGSGAAGGEDGDVLLEAAADDRLPHQVVRVAAAHRSTAGLGPMFGTVTVERVAPPQGDEAAQPEAAGVAAPGAAGKG
ncbi:MAG: molybdopterin-dependent oxidoreductase, partial [Burkholderiales bacterium]